ncbi:hypothetical protein MBLNU459_g7353t1 [Dothideomycetes sp. NU459]
MSEEYSQYLAIQVLNEGQTVSYRSLSRALKVHSNLAKQMLYEFHHKQNSNKAGTLHATYLLTGTQRALSQSSQTNGGTHSQDGGDVSMRSSPFPSSSAPQPKDEDSQQEQVYTKLVTLAREEDLGDAKAHFDQLHSVHIYSLEPGTIKDLHVLAECNRSVAATYATEDPLEMWRQYGVIQNANVRRRTARRPPPPPAAPARAPKAAKPGPTSKTEPEKSSQTAKETAKDTKASNLTPATANPEPEQKKSNTGKPVPVKRESSSLFKSFAKTKAPLKKQDTASSAEASPAPTPVEDEPMGGLSDEEAGDDDAAMFNEGAITESTGGKSRKEREEELRAMMDAEDESMDDVSAAETPRPDPVEETDDSQSKAQPPEPEPVETVTVSDGRRRGRRRVMKKKTVKDEEGYLVTREEAAWESFSEDEPAAKKPKLTAPPPAAPKGKKGGTKPGQGSIMSFFSKK